jgi:ABC-2 type transport system permease protein
MSAADTALPRPATRLASVRLLRSELRLIMGRRRNQAGLLVLASVPILLGLALKFAQPPEGRGPDFFSAATSSGAFVAVTALTIEITLFLPLAVAVLAGDAIAGEANLGTLRNLLTVPVNRTRLLVVKYAALVIGAFVGVAVVAVTGLVVGSVLFGTGPTTLLSGTQVGFADAAGRLAIAVLYLTGGLAGLAAVGLLVSTLTEQPIGAMIAVTITATAMWILNGIPQLSWLQPWLLVHYWPAFADAFRDPVYLDDMRQGLLVSLGYVVVFGSMAWARFSQKDITG